MFVALASFQDFGLTLARTVEDSSELFQDAFDDLDSRPIDLLPKPAVRQSSSIDVPLSSSEYQWCGLSEESKSVTRLVRIERGNVPQSESTQIRCDVLPTGLPIPQMKCQIFAVDLDNMQEEYEAVSYTWLDMDAGIPLLINDKEILLVNASLFACLQHLLKRGDSLTLWWDNISVNQTDEAEIGKQVALMKDIYGRAKRTYIWLGESDPDSDLAIKTLGEICPLSGGETTSDQDRQRKAEALVTQGFRDPASEASLSRSAIARLLNRKYFERAWIYQEAAVSKRLVVLIGDQELAFDRLCDAVNAYCAAEGDKLRRSEISLGNPLRNVAHGYNTLQAIRQGRRDCEALKSGTLPDDHLQNILCRLAGGVRARRDHDLVYAFLGFQSCARARIQANYKMSIGAAYTDAARSLMEQTGNLDLFGICGGDEKLPDLASWAPNWTVRLPQGQPIHQSGVKSPFNACKDMKFTAHPQPESPPSRLVVRGRIIDAVAAVHEFDFKYAERNTLGIDRFVNLAGHVDFLNKNPQDRQNQGRIGRARVLRALLADGAYSYSSQIFNEETTTQKSLSDSLLTSLLQAYDQDSTLRQYKRGTSDRLDKLKDFYSMLRNKSLICVRKRLFLSDKGLLGLAPEGIGNKDIVCILNGSSVPVALRRWESNGQQATYRLIGQVYLEDTMYGEKVDWENDSQADEIVLV